MPTPRILSLIGSAALVMSLLCSCNEARTPPIARRDALSDRTVREVTVIKVWDQVENRVDGMNDPNVSHVVEVDVASGDDKGTQLTFPFDAWSTGKRPPAVGSTVMMCPADWVRRDPRSNGRPFNE
jgi:hypothetical protein